MFVLNRLGWCTGSADSQLGYARRLVESRNIGIDLLWRMTWSCILSIYNMWSDFYLDSSPQFFKCGSIFSHHLPKEHQIAFHWLTRCFIPFLGSCAIPHSNSNSRGEMDSTEAVFEQIVHSLTPAALYQCLEGVSFGLETFWFQFLLHYTVHRVIVTHGTDTDPLAHYVQSDHDKLINIT